MLLTSAFVFARYETGTCSEPTIVAPEEAGMDEARLERIGPSMKRFIDEGDIRGCVTLVARHGKVVQFDGYGKVGKDTIFRIASMTKPVTAVAALILYEEGRFLLDDPLAKYIPEFADPVVLEPLPPGESSGKPYRIVPAYQEITVRHIFNHTSGITYGGGMLREFYDKENIGSGLRVSEDTIGDMVKRLADLPLAHHPGEAWAYGLSNDVLGYFIEVVSGKPLDEFVRERIFEPLGMDDTAFYPPESKLDRVALMSSCDADGVLHSQPDAERDAYLRGPRRYFSGGGGLFSTASDYYRFAQMLLNGGELDGVRILGRKTVELMTSDSTGGIDILGGTGHTRATHGDRYGLGLGIRACPGDIESIGTFGWGGAFNTLFWVDPAEDMIGIFMSQVRGQPDKTMHRVFRIHAYSAIAD